MVKTQINNITTHTSYILYIYTDYIYALSSIYETK